MSTTDTSIDTPLTPELPPQPKPSSQSPRSKSKVFTKEVSALPNRWLIAANKITEKKKSPKEELMRRLISTKEKIIKEFQNEWMDVSDETLTDVERESRIKVNENINTRLDEELNAQMEMHKMAIRLVIQYNITTEEAVSMAETELREEKEFSLEKNTKHPPNAESSIRAGPWSLEEEIKQYARQLEETKKLEPENAFAVAKREVLKLKAEREKHVQCHDHTSTVHSTDQLFASVFSDQLDDINATREHRTMSEQTPPHYIGSTTVDDKISAAAALLLDEDLSQGDTLVVKARSQSLHENPADQEHVNRPSQASKRFSNAVFKVVDQNKAKRDAYKSLAQASLSKASVRENLPLNSKSDDASEEKIKYSEASAVVNQTQGHEKKDKPIPQRHNLWISAVNKVVEQSKNKQEAFLSLSKGNLEQTEQNRSIEKESSLENMTNSSPSILRQNSSTNPILNRAKSSVSSLAHSSKTKSRSRLSSSESTVVPTQSEFQDAYNSAVTNAQETARLSEEREDDKNKKREKKKAKKLSKLVKAAQLLSDTSTLQAHRVQERANVDQEIQEDIYKSEIAIKNASQHMSLTAAVVVDSISKLNKHDVAVKRLQEEAARIKKRQESDDENRNILEDEERFQLSEKRKNAYYADWYKVQSDLSSLRENLTADSNSALQAELNASPYVQDLRARGLQEKIAEEVQKTIIREEQREQRTLQRLRELEQQHQERSYHS